MTTAAPEQTVSAIELGVAMGPRVRRRFGLRSLKLTTGIAIVSIFILMGMIGPLVAPYDPSALGDAPLAAPTMAHWLGTTQTGQDVLSQLLVGAQQTLIIGFLAGAIATTLSAIVGIAGAFLGGAADEIVSVITNIFLVLPALPLLIVLTGYIPSAGPVAIAVVISLTGWAWGARVMRAQTLSLRKRDYVEAASIAGDSKWRIILFEILPNQRAIIASSFLFTVLFAILTQVGLAFLGLVDVSQWSWGVMLYWAQQGDALGAGAYWWFIPPGLCVALLGTGLALANFGLDEYINPRLRIPQSGKRRTRDVDGFTPVRRSESDEAERAARGTVRKGAGK